MLCWASVASRKLVDTVPTSFWPSGRVHVERWNPENTKKNLDSGFRRNDEKRHRLCQ
jgi:hypothetical protein